MIETSHAHEWIIKYFKLLVIFGKRAINYRALLRKMTCKDKASYGSSPSCIIETPHACEWVTSHI